MTTALEARGVCKAFAGLRAVDGLNLTLREGELVALIGPNGAGKTTLLNLLGGQLRPDAGSVYLDGEEITHWPAARRARAGLARTFQVPALFPELTVREHIVAARLRGRWTLRFPPDAEGVEELLERCRLLEKASRGAGELSHGDRRLLELAVALAPEPRALLLDEPAAGLSPAEVEGLLALLRDLRRERPSLAVLVVEHDMDVVFELAERVVVMHRGRVLAEGTPADIQRDPEVQAVYLGARVP